MSRRGARAAFVARSEASVGHVAKETGACGIVGDVSRKEAIHPIARTKNHAPRQCSRLTPFVSGVRNIATIAAIA
jgi:hypothetical protein